MQGLGWVGLGLRQLPCDSHAWPGKGAGISSPRLGGFPGDLAFPLLTESWLQFELMLLRRSRWVPQGPFRRLQIAFKPIHPGEGEGGELTA